MLWMKYCSFNVHNYKSLNINQMYEIIENNVHIYTIIENNVNL